MADNLEPLTEAGCPLLPESVRAELVAKFNRTVELLNFAWEIASQSGTAEELLNKFEFDLGKIRDLLSREVYTVGFLGPFQAGKSRTCSQILGARRGTEPTGIGQGFPTTAVVTRLRRSPRSGENSNALRVFFLTRDEYNHKRKFLAQITGIDAQRDDEQILREIVAALRDWQKRVRVTVDAAGNEVPVRRRDLDYFGLLLRSYQSFSNYIKERRQIEEGIPFERRAKYLNHPPDPWHEQHGVITPLIREVEISYCTDVIPSTLEMVDLPGYDGECSIDAFVTDQFLKTLQGALVFCRATDFGGVVETIINHLRRVFGNDLRGRLWLVITRCDDINLLPQGSPHGQTIFRQLATFIQAKGIPPTQVLFVTNEVEEFRNRFSQVDARNNLESALRDIETDWPELRNQWKLLEQDGGIGSLRELIATEMASAVSRSIARSAGPQLREIYGRLLELCRQQLDEHLLASLPEQILQWRNELLTLRLDVSSAAAVYRLSKQIEQDLLDSWGQIVPSSQVLADVIQNEGNAGLAKEFELHARVLDRKIKNFLITKWLPQTHEEVRRRVEHLEDSKGVLRLRGVCDDGITGVLQKMLERDLADQKALVADVPEYGRNSPFQDVPRDAEPIFAAEEYLEVFQQKHEAMARQLAIFCSHRLSKLFENVLNDIKDYSRLLHERGDVSIPPSWLQRLEEFNKWEEPYEPTVS